MSASICQISEAHYGVRNYIAKCLSTRTGHRTYVLDLAFCHKLGFGIRQDIAECRRLVSSIPMISMEDLDHIVNKVKETKEAPIFQKSLFSRSSQQGYFSAFDFSQQYNEEQRLREAEQQYRREVETLGLILGDHHFLVCGSRRRFSRLLRYQGKWADAERVQLRTLELARDNSNQMLSLSALEHDLATTYIDQGRWKEAEKLVMHIVQTTKRLLGKKHPSTLSSIQSLAFIYSELG